MIFISYRRSESLDFSRRLAAVLCERFGSSTVFFDESSVTPGAPWPAEIRNKLEQAVALLVVIGDRWLRSYDPESGRRRIDMEDDWVRQEIMTFLDRVEANPNLLLLPLLIRDATLPQTEHLDSALGRICDYQYLVVPDTASVLDFVSVTQRLSQFGFERITAPPVVTLMVGKIPNRLRADEERAFLEQHPYWRIVESEKPGSTDDVMRQLYRMYEFSSYEMAWQFMTRVDKEGIRPYNHHPCWQNTYNRVEFWLCTFNIGHKPSKRDIRLARIAESIWHEFEAEMLA